MKRFLAICAALAGVLAMSSEPVHAQWTGSRIGTNAKKTDPGEVMQVTAQCIAERGPSYAEKIMRELPGSDEEFRLIRTNEGDISNCMDNSEMAIGSVELTFTARGFRQALASEMTRKLVRKIDVDLARLGGGEPWFLDDVRAAPESAELDMAYLSLLEFGDCVVAIAPEASLAYLRTDVGAEAEASRVQALSPALSSCLTAGTDLALDFKTLRVALAEPVYQRLIRLAPGR